MAQVDPGTGTSCSCQTTSSPTPAGEIVVVRVFGEVDLSSDHVLQAALTEAARRRPSHLIVDLVGTTFCSMRGLAFLVNAAVRPPIRRDRYVLTGADPRIERALARGWSADDLPARHPTVRTAVLAAMAEQHTDGPSGSDADTTTRLRTAMSALGETSPP